MRVAVSGTHCCGKTTLVEQFLLAHPDFAHEPEPYASLQEDYGEVFAEEPSAEDFYRQLEFNIARLRDYRPGQQVIFERCPADFLAYLLALDDIRRDQETAQFIEKAVGLAGEGLGHLDLIVYLPLDDMDTGVMPDSEYPELRAAVDDRLVGILGGDDLNFFSSRHPAVLEVRGSTARRLRQVEGAIWGTAE